MLLLSGAGGTSASYRLGWLDSRNEVCAGVGCDVEDGVDGVRQHGEVVLGREEPDKGHD